MALLLISDDSKEIRELYQLEFEGEGYEVITAANGQEALEMTSEHSPDVVILDIGMPEKDGLDVIGEVSRMHGGTPVIVNTAYPLFKLDYRAHHAVTWITKSSNMDNLMDAVKKVIAP